MEPHHHAVVAIGKGRGGRGRGYRPILPSTRKTEPLVDISEKTSVSEDSMLVEKLEPPEQGVDRANVTKPKPCSGSISLESHTHAGTQLKHVKDYDASETVGVSGERRQCLTNFVKLNRTSVVPVFQYHVSFEPTLESTKLKKRMMKQLEKVIGYVSSFDGHTLYLPKQLTDKVSVITCIHPDHDSTTVAITIKFISVRENPAELTQFYNSLFQRILLNHGFVEIRRGFYKLSDVRDLPRERLQIWPGVALSVEMKDDGLMVMFDTPSRVMRTETLYDFYKQMKDKEENVKMFRESFATFVIGKIVLCQYSNQCYKIDDVAWDLTPSSTFCFKKREITYAEYFKKQYNVTVTDLNQAMVLSTIRPRNVGHPNPPMEAVRAVALVPELCYTTGLTSVQRFNKKLVTEICAITRLNPRLRINAMNELIEEITRSTKSKDILAHWGLELDSEILAVTGRRINPPALMFDATSDPKLISTNFSKDASRSCLNPVSVVKFFVFCVRKELEHARNFLMEYEEACSSVGIQLRTSGEIIEVDSNREMITPSLFVKALETSCKHHEKLQFVVIILPFRREDIYRAVKKYCLTIASIPSQCVLSRTLNQRSIKQSMINICLQINCKLGGSLWGLKMPKIKKTMIVGMDAAHDPSRKNPSVIALVATLNATSTMYFARCSLQPIHQEICTSLRVIFKDALQAYRKCNAGDLPDHIIFYRDGGNVGTFEILKKYEVDVCLEVLREDSVMEIKKGINFSYVCVAKRIPEKIFIMSEGKNIENPPSGTVLDNGITESSRYDFYIVSQQVRQGTVNPTHYSVIYETKRTKPDCMQQIAYALTFMYYNWSGSVKVPSVIQYSHKLGQLVSRIQAVPNRSLSNNLFFL